MPAKRRMPFYRVLEIGSVFLFVLCTIALFIVLPPQTQAQAENSDQIEVITSAMPNQGWAPLTVYFSAFGSEAENAAIVKYEWDLDGNGIYDTDATTQSGYAQYTYNKPGEYTVKLRLTDALGNQSVGTTIINVRHPGSSSVDYWTVFNQEKVEKVTVSLSQANWNLLWANIENKIEVPADALIFNETLEDIGFRMRGQFSMRMSGEKKPWKINTDAYIADQEFNNLRQLLFVNAIGDETLMKEMLAYDMMHFAGIPSSHISYVEVWIDITDDTSPAEFWGVYTMIERVDRKFLSSRFGTDAKDGNLYKASHAQRGPMDLAYYGPSIESYPTQDGQYAYGKENNEEEADYSDIVELCYVIDGATYATPEEFATALEEVFNVDGYLRYQAVTDLTMNWDSYQNTGNNFYLFNNPTTGKFEWIPWDLTWGGEANMTIMQSSVVGISEHAPLFDNVFEVERYRKQYSAYLDLLMRNYFNEAQIYQKTYQYHELITPYLYQGNGDKMYTGEGAWFSLEQYENGWIELSKLTGKRNAYIQQLLDSQVYLLNQSNSP
ncbi:MAG: CotH kinase family protein [Anaerolineaceae bacterium]|nr:CotH kinase family protein [Anaerolineaceae bacterium]